MTMRFGSGCVCVPLLLVLFGMAATGAAAQATWSISERPTLVIGTVDGPPLSVFHHIGGVMSVHDTLIVVADGGSKELRVFTSRGVAVTAFGGEGDGPREFREIRWAERCGGTSIVVYDALRRRVTKWDAQGNLLEGFNVESTVESRPAYALSCGPTGEFAVVGWPDVLSYRGGQGPHRPETNVGVLNAEGRLDRVLGNFPGPERYRYGGDRLSDGPRPFGKTTIVRMGRQGAFVGTGDAYEIAVFRPDGSSFTFGRSHAPRELTADMLEFWQDSLLALTAEGSRREIREALRRYEIPEALPAYSDFRFDDLGLVWVALFPPPGQDRVHWDVWEVSDPDAAHIASIQIPRHIQPMEIARDYLLGVRTDSMRVQRVHRYRLFR